MSRESTEDEGRIKQPPKMTGITTYVSIAIKNVNGLISPIKYSIWCIE
jgi:hypothetical protein